MKCKQSKNFKHEYNSIIKPTLISWHNNRPHQERLILNQTGGTLYTMSTVKQKIEIEVEELKSVVTEDEEISHRIIFFHPKYSAEYASKGYGFFKYCVLVKIYADDKIAEISDLNRYYPCFDGTNLKFGKTIMNGVIFFLNKYKQSLSINAVELQDNSSHWCEGDSKYNIQLVFSRQLLGIEPYYWQFGFRPVSSKIISRINDNIQLVNALDIDTNISKYGNILDYLAMWFPRDHPDWEMWELQYTKHDKLVTFLRWFSQNYCKLYFEFYMQLFYLLGLTSPYSGLDEQWRLTFV